MARNFDKAGGTDFIDCGDIDLSTETDITAMAWVKYVGGGSAEHTVISNWIAAGAAILVRIEPATDTLELFANATGSAVTLDATDLAISTTAWAHVLFTYNSTDGMAAFVDGVKSSVTTAADGAMHGSLDTTNFRIGFRSGDLMDGDIAEVCIWTATLSDTEIAQLANGAHPMRFRRSSVKGYWPLYGLASPEPDLSGGALHGTVSGPVASSHAPVGRYVPAPRWTLPLDVIGAAPSGSLLVNPGMSGGMQELTGGIRG